MRIAPNRQGCAAAGPASSWTKPLHRVLLPETAETKKQQPNQLSSYSSNSSRRCLLLRSLAVTQLQEDEAAAVAAHSPAFSFETHLPRAEGMGNGASGMGPSNGYLDEDWDNAANGNWRAAPAKELDRLGGAP